MIINAHTTLVEDQDGCHAEVLDFTGQIHRIKVKKEDVLRWRDGDLIQRALPYLSANERELMISGIPGDIFDNLFCGTDEE